ncbi:flagellar motor protein MotB [Marinomonas ostreistagni]|uniref:flagellar motor protein MotB n=1 Tax=Marinomonas ostreistagni TaxID=359209 RepID=UPI001951F90E|nr:flagellar motor protein MotB [Marinomonas ostreistagni]MBM6551268.1 OmpA family protein [Marinomonas ostreistagni]
MSDEESTRRPRRRARQSYKNEELKRDRWILSYADFITLLFAFFVALYSLSLKEAGDEKVLAETLNGVFDAVQKSIKPINIGEPTAGQPDSERLLEVAPDEPTEFENPPGEVEGRSPLFEVLNQSITSQFPTLERDGQLTITEDAEWVTLDMKAALVFGQGDYELTNEAVALMIVIANILRSYPAPIMVLGNTDDMPINSNRMPSNWHLSSMRAAAVAEELVYRGIDPKLLAPIGFSSENPQVRNTNDYARAQNRRVTLKISKRMADNLYDYLFQ